MYVYILSIHCTFNTVHLYSTVDYCTVIYCTVTTEGQRQYMHAIETDAVH